jgi:nitroreductase
MFMSLIQKRRSIRQFQDKAIEAEKIDRLAEAAVRAPSSRGVNPWQFVFVTDRGMLDRLSRAKPHGASFLKGAALGIVVCADPSKSDVWVEDASIATIMLLLAAESLDLGGCWIQIRERSHSEGKMAQDYIRELLNIPNELQVEAMVAVGYPAEQKSPHGPKELQFEKVHRGVYGKPYE